MKRLAASAALLLAAFAAHAQTTYNLSPFNSASDCTTAATKLGMASEGCATTFVTKPVASTLVLGNLPPNPTTATSAKIDASVTPAASVWCRLDNWAPIPCPQTFSLGVVTPLAPGQHKVDYYVGTTYDVTKPTRTYAWTITAPPTVPPPPNTATPLPALKNASWEGNGQDVSYSGQTIAGSDGLARIKTNADGTTEQRTVQGDAKNWSGNRSELSGWSSPVRVTMNPGADYWFAFAVKPLTWGGGRQIFWQIHQDTGTQPSGCNGPTFEMQLADGALQINSVTGSSSVWTCNSLLNSATYAPAVGKWSKFVVHFRPGYLASQSPKTEVWKDGVLVYSSTNINTQPGANDYPKMGIYKWDDAWSGVNQRAAQYSSLFFGQGVDLKANADASLASIK